MSRYIYGRRKAKPLDIFKTQVLIVSYIAPTLQSMIEQTNEVIEILVQLRYDLLFIGDMRGTSSVSPPMMVRLLWSGKNPKKRFDKTNKFHILQLKDLYLSMRQPWEQDPLLMSLG
jgi:hypothetical protein